MLLEKAMTVSQDQKNESFYFVSYVLKAWRGTYLISERSPLNTAERDSPLAQKYFGTTAERESPLAQKSFRYLFTAVFSRSKYFTRSEPAEEMI